MRDRISFEGSFIEYFVISLALLFLSVVTLGLALPYYGYWSLKYFFTKLRIGDRRIVFTGNFGEYFLKALGLIVLSLLTLGLLLPYLAYWSYKYFFTRLELVTDGAQVPSAKRGASTQQATPRSRKLPVIAAPAVEPVVPSARGEVASTGQPSAPAEEEATAAPESSEEHAPRQYQFGSPR